MSAATNNPLLETPMNQKNCCEGEMFDNVPCMNPSPRPCSKKLWMIVRSLASGVLIVCVFGALCALSMFVVPILRASFFV